MNVIIYHFARFFRRFGVDFGAANDSRVKAMQTAIQKIGAIEFTIEVAEDGSWVAESKNIDGIITGGTKSQNIQEMIKDATFTYFEIPPQLCDERLMKTTGEKVTLEQRVYA